MGHTYRSYDARYPVDSKSIESSSMTKLSLKTEDNSNVKFNVIVSKKSQEHDIVDLKNP